jgi:hypothetical protein
VGSHHFRHPLQRAVVSAFARGSGRGYPDQAFFRTYPRLRPSHGVSHNKTEAGGTQIGTRSDRRRPIPHNTTKWERFTALVNTPVLGGTADGWKRAISLLGGRLPEGAMLVSTVHDSTRQVSPASFPPSKRGTRPVLLESNRGSVPVQFPPSR